MRRTSKFAKKASGRRSVFICYGYSSFCVHFFCLSFLSSAHLSIFLPILADSLSVFPTLNHMIGLQMSNAMD